MVFLKSSLCSVIKYLIKKHPHLRSKEWLKSQESLSIVAVTQLDGDGTFSNNSEKVFLCKFAKYINWLTMKTISLYISLLHCPKMVIQP